MIRIFSWLHHTKIFLRNKNLILNRYTTTVRTSTSSNYRRIFVDHIAPLAMDLQEIVKIMESLAPTSTAEEWDNVGLLVEPSNPSPISHILLTNDLTESVMKEALNQEENGCKVGLIVSYHPPIFKPLKRLTQSSPKEKIIIQAIESGIAIYSPHTAHDVLWGGVNDWMLSGISKGIITPLAVKQVASLKSLCLSVGGITDQEDCKKVTNVLCESTNTTQNEVTFSTEETADMFKIFTVKCGIDDRSLRGLLPKLTEQFSNYKITVSQLDKIPKPGAGRLLTLAHPINLNTLVLQVKSHLGLQHLRLAKPDGWTDDKLISSIAVCVGSGASVLRGVKANVYLTGEMSHHDVLDATARGTACILCEHSNTERGFLHVFKKLLEGKLSSTVKLSVSQTDKDPLCIV